MRIGLTGAVALLSLVLPGAALVARAQGWPAYGGPAYAPAYGYPGFAPNVPVYPTYPGYYPPAMPAPPAYPYPPAVPVSLPAVPPAAAMPPAAQDKPAPATPATPAPPAAPKSDPPPVIEGVPSEPTLMYVEPTRPGVLPPNRFNQPEPPGGGCGWLSVGYLLAFMRHENLATPLATTGAALDTHPAGLGQPGTATLFQDQVNFGAFSGISAAAGFYLDDGRTWALDWAGQYYFPNHRGFAAASDPAGNPIIARPIFDVVNGFERAFIDAFPGTAAGGIDIQMRSAFMSTEANLNRTFRPADNVRVDALLGFRYLRLGDNLRVNDVLTSLKGNNIKFLGNFVNAGDVISDFDSFQTANHFYGTQLGSRLQWEWGRFSVGAVGKLGLGATEQHAVINGGTALTNAAGVQTAPGGILALSSNMGSYSHTVFGFVPEIGLDLGVRLTPNMRLTVGYSLLYWNQVARVGDVVSRAVNPSLVPSDNSFGLGSTTPAPVFQFSSSSFWISSFNFGLNFEF